MAQGSRLTVEEQARIAELAATGLPSRLIGQELGRSHRAVWSYVVKLRQPPPRERRRSPLRLSLVEREEISRGLAGGRVVAGDRSPAGSGAVDGVSRGGPQSVAGAAIGRVERIATRSLGRVDPKVAKLAGCERLRRVVETKLELRWSPQQIAGWLPTSVPWRSGDAGVARDDLPVVVRAVPRRAAQGTHPLSASRPRHPPTTRTLDQQRARPTAAGRSTSANGPPRPRTGPCPGTGKATCCSANA